MGSSHETKHTDDRPPPYRDEPDGEQLQEQLPLYEDEALTVQHSNHSDDQPGDRRSTRAGCSRLVFMIKAAVTFFVVVLISFNAIGLISRALPRHRHWSISRPGPHMSRPSSHFPPAHGVKPHCIKPVASPAPLRPSTSDHKNHAAENRRYKRHEIFRSITGDFPLYDLLELSTVSGSIDVTVTPHPGTEPAVLRIHSNAGSITVRLSDQYLTTTQSQLAHHPDAIDTHPALASINRTFTTEIKTQAGAIHATILAGNGGTTVIESAAGSIDLDLLAVGVGPHDDHGASYLRTLTHSGQQNIRVGSLQRFGAPAMKKLVGAHISRGSSALDIRYPGEWEGELEGEIWGSGSTDIFGRGLEVDERGDSGFRAHRGEGGETVKILEQGSGSVKFRC